MNIEGGIFYFNFLRRKFVIFFVFSVYIILDGGGEQALYIFSKVCSLLLPSRYSQYRDLLYLVSSF